MDVEPDCDLNFGWYTWDDHNDHKALESELSELSERHEAACEEDSAWVQSENTGCAAWLSLDHIGWGALLMGFFIGEPSLVLFALFMLMWSSKNFGTADSGEDNSEDSSGTE
eukprot:jgi/Mesvir1/25961/Mv20951-RA.1